MRTKYLNNLNILANLVCTAHPTVILACTSGSLNPQPRKLNKMKNLFIYTLLAICLSACAAKDSTRYYQLPESAFRAPMSRGNEVALRVELATHLAGENLLYQTDAYHLNFAQKNLWAAPLDDALAANLANKLNTLSGSRAYVPHKLANGKTPVFKVYFDRFQGTYRGETEVSGYAQLGDGGRVPFAVNTPQQGDGYEAMVASLNMGLAEVAKLVAH